MADEPKTGMIRIQLPNKVDGEAKYANHVLANFTGEEFVITFAQVIPPPILPGDPIPDYLREGYIDANVIGRMVLSADKFVEVTQNWARLVARLQETGRLPKRDGEETPTNDAS